MLNRWESETDFEVTELEKTKNILQQKGDERLQKENKINEEERKIYKKREERIAD